MIYGWDEEAMGQAALDGHAMFPGNDRDLHAERHAEGGTGYSMFADREARRVLGDRTWHRTAVRSMGRPAFGPRPSSWEHPGATGDLGAYDGGGLLGMRSAFGGRVPWEGRPAAGPGQGAVQAEDTSGWDGPLGSPPLGGGWAGVVASIDGYAGGGLMGLPGGGGAP